MPAPALHSCGIALGNVNCYIAVGRGGGIEILLNDYSQRSTPACVSFGDQQRLIGVAATQNQLLNLQNTIYNLKKLIGRTHEEFIKNGMANQLNVPFKIESGPEGQIMVRVRHNGQERNFTVVQVMAMLLTKLRETALNVTDCVINCPNYYNETQRRALVDAARIAGLNPLQLLPDLSAIALNYAYFRTSKDDQEQKILAFVDCGQSSVQAAVMWFNMKQETIRVLAADYEPNMGGGNFDEVLADYFVQNHNLKLTTKARFRLLAECEKLKKLLSANSNEIPISVECLESDEKDFTSRIDRAKFESIAEPYFNQIEACFQRTLKAASANFEAYKQKCGEANEMIELMFGIQGVEVVGGSSRVPAIKRLVKSVFGVDASTTLNADEAVACGCALQCASLHPVFKVKRDIKISDLNPSEGGDNQSPPQGSLNEQDFGDCRAVELSLIANDREWKSKMDARNSLEEFIYDWRSKLESGSCDHLIKPKIKETFQADITSIEDWLYDGEGQSGTIKVYEEKLAELKKKYLLPPKPTVNDNHKAEQEKAGKDPQQQSPPQPQQQQQPQQPGKEQEETKQNKGAGQQESKPEKQPEQESEQSEPMQTDQ